MFTKWILYQFILTFQSPVNTNRLLSNEGYRLFNANYSLEGVVCLNGTF